MNRKYILNLFILIIGFSLVLLKVNAQDLITPTLNLSYKKTGDESKKLSIILKYKQKKAFIGIENANLQIFANGDNSKIKLGTLVTNWKGETFYIIPASTQLIKKDGKYDFTVIYDGDKKFEKAEENIKVKDAFLNMELSKDTSKTITVKAFEINDKGDKIPLKDIEIVFSVPRLFGLFSFAKEKLDETGQCSTTFISNIPGDINGRIDAVASIVENDDYGTVEQSKLTTWGIPTAPGLQEKRTLGDTDAPLWMVYTLLVLLPAVWFHFMYIIYLLKRINSIGKKKAEMLT